MAKKDDPNYEQVRGHVPKPLARQFKQYCLDEEIDYSEGLERLLASFFERGRQNETRPEQQQRDRRSRQSGKD